MRRRGRPPYPDVLTPREWEVLALLREGLSNEEIAERLGFSLAGAKYHVSEILGKLGVSSREEAASWSPERRPSWATALVPIVGLWRRGTSSTAATVATAGVVVVVAAGVALLGWGLLRTSGGGGTSQPSNGQIALGEGRYGGVDWSPDGRSIAFALDGRLYRADAPDFQRRLLAQAAPNDGGLAEPRWSPDGSRIGLLGSHAGRGGSPNDSSYTIFVVNADGSGLRDLLPGDKADLAPTNAKDMRGWLDGHTLLFEQGCGTACRLPYRLDVDTGEMEKVVQFPGVTTGSEGVGILGTVYHWSPDQRWIAVENMARYTEVIVYDRQKQQAISLAPPPGDPGTGGPFGPWQWFDAWAPDSSAFLYEKSAVGSDGAPAPPYSLHLYNPSTREDRTLAAVGKSGSFSADGSRVAYVTEQSNDHPCPGGPPDVACIAVMDVASGRELYRFPGPMDFVRNSQQADVAGPQFLPDGRILYFTAGADLGLADGEHTGALYDAVDLIHVHPAPDGSSVVVAEPARLTLIPVPARGGPALPTPGPLSPPSGLHPPDEPPFAIAGPLDATEALSGDNLAASAFVLDVRSGQVYIVQQDQSVFQSGDSFGVLGWLDADTLLVDAFSGGEPRLFGAGLDGSTRVVTDVITPTPSAGQPAVSADEAWVASVTAGAGPGGDLLIGRTAKLTQYHLTSAIEGAWSPTADKLAFVGNVCSGFDIFTFDPVSGELRNLTAGLQDAALTFAWRPDGAALAVDLLPLNAEHSILGLIDATTGAMQPLIDVPIPGELAPWQWSPDGNRLLFHYSGGSGLCDTAAGTSAGTPVTGTQLERLGG